MNWKRKFLASDEEEKIENKIKAFESNTGSELVLCIAKSSDQYPAAILRFAVILSFICSFCISFYFEFEFSFYPIILQFLFFVFFAFIGKLKFLKKYFLSTVEVLREVDEKSIEVFYLLGSSQDHNGHILLYISLLERKIKLLVGKKIAQQMTQEELNEMVLMLQGEFKQKHFFTGLSRSIELLEAQIKKYFPEKVIQNLPNQIENRIFWQDFT
ncbi:MAG: hypothetical protein JNM93_09020 [Bacteriovoracaceae bacterium]|nr:hypothetical protein [Bacteriovoracaceae bacterium]